MLPGENRELWRHMAIATIRHVAFFKLKFTEYAAISTH